MEQDSQPIRTLSSTIDEIFRPLGKPIGSLMSDIGGGISDAIAPSYSPRVRNVLQQTGEGLPRFGAEAMAYGSKNPWLKLAGLGDVAMKNYADTGSIPQTLAHTSAFALAPVAGSVGAKAAGGLVPAAQSMVSSPGAKYLAGEAVRRVGSTAASIAPFEAADYATSKMRDEPFDPLSLENVVGTAAGVLPFEAMHVPGIVKGFKEASKPLVNTIPKQDIKQGFKVSWETPDETPREMQFLDEDRAKVFSDELRRHGMEPVVEAGVPTPRAFDTHEMAFKPEQLQANIFGHRTSEVLNEMGDKEIPSSQIMGTIRNKVPKTELEALPGLEEFVKSKPKVAVKEVQEWIDKNAPKVEVRKAGEGAASPERKELLELTHKLDTINPDWGRLTAQDLPPEAQPLLSRFQELVTTNAQETDPGSVPHANWAFVAPKPEDQMPGYVEIAVVRPYKADPKTYPYGPSGVPSFPESHSFPPNTLGFTRGYMETTPDGKKVFHVIEAQSDWAKISEDGGEYITWDGEHFASRTEAKKHLAKQDSMLGNYEHLLLKATVHHAIREGADEIAVSDPETAMMTEGHDRQPQLHGQFATRESAERHIADNDHLFPGGKAEKVGDVWKIREAIPQEQGMRLHYGQIIPGILRDLTGVKGERREFGEHKNAMYETPPNGAKLPREDLIFKDSQGNPKTTVSALSFSLSRTKSELSKRGGFPLYGSGKFLSDHVKEMQMQGYDPDQIMRAVENLKQLQPLKGETPLQTLARQAGIDPKLFATMAPGEALPKAFEFLTSMFHYNYAEPIERAAYLAKQVMVPLARFAPWLKNTQFAVAGANERGSKYFAAKEPESEMFKYLITLHDFPKSPWASRQGPDTQAFEVARTLGHEATHNMIHEALNPVGSTTPDQYRSVLKALAQVEAIPADSRPAVLQNMLRLIVPSNRWPEVSKVNFDRSADDPHEFLSDFAAILSVGAVDKKTLRNMQDALTFGDEASKDFSNAVYRDLSSVWTGVKNWLGMTPEKNVALTKAIDSIHDNLTKLMTTREEANRTLAGFSSLMDRVQAGVLDPPPVVSAQQMHAVFRRLDDLADVPGIPREAEMKMLDDTLAWLRPEESPIGGARLSFFKDFFKPMGQLVETLKDKVPSVLPVFGLATDYQGMAAQLQKQTWQLFANDKGKIDWKRLSWISKEGSVQNKAFNALALVENVRTQKGNATSMLDRAGREKVSPEYKALSDEDKGKVDRSLDQLNGMGRFLAIKKWNAFRDRVAWGMSKVIMSYNKDLYHDKAKEFADEAVKRVFDNDVLPQGLMSFVPIEPPAQALLQQKLEQNKVEWLKMGDKMLGAVDPATGERPGKTFYLPEVRIGDWHLAYKLKGEDVPHHEAFKSQAAATKKRAEIQASPDLEWLKDFNAKDRADRFRGMVQEDISAVQQDALDVLYNSTLSAISTAHPEANEIIAQIKAEVQPAAAFANIAVSPYMREREFIPGREDLNMVEGMTRYVDASAYNVAKGHVKQAAVAALYNPDFRANPNVRNEFDKYVKFVTDAEGKEFTMMKNLVFFNYIGFNPATMLQEPMQQLVSLVPYMIEHGMGIGKAYKSLRKANMDSLKYTLKDKLDNPVTDRALKEAIEKRVVDTGFISDLHGETDFDFAASMSSTIGQDGIKKGVDLLKKPLYSLLSVARHVYGVTTAHNSKVAFITAFEHEYGRNGGDYDKAMQFATQATHATMFGGGKAARPLVLQRFGNMTGVGGLMYTLGSYSLNSIAMMARLARKSIMAGNLSVADKNASIKAAGVMFATQFALAGALGLPLIAPGLAVLEQIFPGLDARKLAREGAVNLAKLASDDEDWGHMVADGALRGMLNLSGTDFGSRFQLANMMGVSPYDGFSWKNVAGPASSMLENWVKATGQASEGRFGDAARTAAPAAAKNLMNLVHNDFAVRDKMGRMITPLSMNERVLMGLGFKPSRVTDYQEQQRINERMEERKTQQLRDIRQEAAKLMSDGDIQGARKVIMDGVHESGPYDPFDMARSAAQLAQDMQNPVQRRQVSKSMAKEEGDVGRLYPQQQKGQSEVQRTLQASTLARGMGLGVRPGLGELRTASLVDSLMAQNPRLSLPEARALATQMTSRTARRHAAVAGL